MGITTKSITSPINIIDIQNTITQVSGEFVYINFNKDELSSPENSDLKDDIKTPAYPDRFLKIKITPNLAVSENSALEKTFLDSLSTLTGTDIVLTQESTELSLRNVYFAQDFVNGFVRMSADNSENIEKNSAATLDSTGDNHKTLMSYIKNNVSFSSYLTGSLDSYEAALRGETDASAGLVAMDPLTNLPLIKQNITSSIGNDSYISSYYLENIVKKSKDSPIVRNISDRTLKLASFISSASEDQKEDRYLSNMKAMLDAAQGGFGLGLPDGASKDTIKDHPNNVHMIHIGWHILKYEKTNAGNDIYKASFLFPKSTQQQTNSEPGDEGLFEPFKDPYVLYGKTYKYEIRDAYMGICTDGNVLSPSFTGNIIIGTQSVPLEIPCVEKLPPPTPSSFSFEYTVDGMIRLSWLKEFKNLILAPYSPNGEGDDQTVVTDDIAGYVLFVRNSLQESYKIEKQFHIIKKLRNYETTDSQTVVKEHELGVKYPPSIIGAEIPNSDIIYVEDFRRQVYDLSIRSNSDYYIAFASYDVHGNLSNYSEQFFLRRNNVTGEVITKLVSTKGASLQYPNTLIPTKFVLSSFKSSGYKYLDLFQTPDTTGSYPSNGNITIHMVDLETENDAVLSSE